MSSGSDLDPSHWDELILGQFISRPTQETQSQILEALPAEVAAAWPGDAVRRQLLAIEAGAWIVLPAGHDAARRNEGVTEISTALPTLGSRVRERWKRTRRRGR